MSKKSSLPGCLTGLALVTVAAGGAYLYLRGQLPWQKFDPLQAARVVPEKAFAAGFVTTDPQAWSALAKYGTPAAQDLVGRGLTEFQNNLADNLDYGRDIQPWIGGATVAFLPSPGGSPGVLLVAGIRDKLKANEFAQKMQGQKNRTATEIDYQGVKITKMTSDKTGDLYTAVVGDYLLLGVDRPVVEAAIDTYRGQPSFAGKAEVKSLLDQSLDLENPLARVVVDDYATMVASGMNLPPESLQQLKKIQGMVAGMGTTDGGIHFQAVAKVDPSIFPNPPAPASDRLLDYYPGDTLVLWTGNNLKQSWTELDRQSKTNPNLQQILRQIRGALQMGSFDADRDVFGWMDGGFAFGLIPSNQSLGGSGIGGLMIWDTGDRKTAESTLDKLNQLAKFAPGLAVGKTPIEGQDVTAWRSGDQTMLTYGWLDQDSLAMTLGIPHQARPTASIAQNPNFQKSIVRFPKENLGYFYADVEGILAKAGGLGNLPAGTVNPEMRALLESVRGVTVTASLPDSTTSKMDASLLLKEVSEKVTH